ncbi:sigma-70 family RNA polymerase sigma factor [Clostridium sp. UBA4548]|uniref:sigma-70 family RNA polymerase sigma factor n=1 Tax=Clostridium sp. UBA4548 TaxID=1946361 RepID=UPI0025BF6486|nr:sigma-70 family RNA polymerase sigma factor [Clostridium sp. UBA4548]
MDYFIGDIMKSVENMIKDYWNKAPGAEEELYNYFLPSVKIQVGKIYYRGYRGQLNYDYDDLIQAGNMAIFNACEVWNNIGLPNNIEASMNRFILYAVLNMKKKIINRRYMPSVNNTLCEDGKEIGDLHRDETTELLYEKVVENIDNGILRKELEELMLSNLSSKYEKALRLRYGFEGRIYSYTEIAKELGVSIDYAHIIEVKALNILRNNKWVEEIGSIYYYGEKVSDYKNKILSSLYSQNNIESFMDWNEKFGSDLSDKLLNIKKWGL